MTVAVATLATREPYCRMADRLGDAIGRWCPRVDSFHLHGPNVDAPDEHPCQAKRFPVREAFDLGDSCVYYIDSDCEPIDRAALARLFVPRAFGIHVQRLYPAALFLRQLHVGRTKPHLDLWRKLKNDLRLGCEPEHMCDWLVCYSLPRPSAASFLRTWDYVAQELRRAGLNWSEGVSIGLAAAANGIPIVVDLPRDDVDAAVKHLRLSTDNDPNWFATWEVPRVAPRG